MPPKVTPSTPVTAAAAAAPTAAASSEPTAAATASSSAAIPTMSPPAAWSGRAVATPTAPLKKSAGKKRLISSAGHTPHPLTKLTKTGAATAMAITTMTAIRTDALSGAAAAGGVHEGRVVFRPLSMNSSQLVYPSCGGKYSAPKKVFGKASSEIKECMKLIREDSSGMFTCAPLPQGGAGFYGSPQKSYNAVPHVSDTFYPRFKIVATVLCVSSGETYEDVIIWGSLGNVLLGTDADSVYDLLEDQEAIDALIAKVIGAEKDLSAWCTLKNHTFNLNLTKNETQ